MGPIDIHTHVFCWGERPEDGFLSRRVQGSWLVRVLLKLTGLPKEPGDTLSDKIRTRLVRELEASQLSQAVVLAQDAVYREDGSRDDARTHFYVSNDYVLRLQAESDKVWPGCSINLWRKDALEELERCYAAGCRLIKIHTSIQGVDPSLERFDPFYALAAELGVVLLFHTGLEHSCPVISQDFANPALLERPLDHGGIVVAAHCGSSAFFDRLDFFPDFVTTMKKYPNLYGDTAIMACWNRPGAMKRLAAETQEIRGRIVHGSDYPLPPSKVPHWRRLTRAERRIKNPLDLDYAIKRTYLGEVEYGSRCRDWLG